MSEREDLITSIADTVKTYRSGEIEEITPAYVERWASQFTPENQLPFLKEFDHVIAQSFQTEDTIRGFLSNLVTNEKLAGDNPKSYWERANFLRIQQAGQSQKAMVNQFSAALYDMYGLKVSDCGDEGGDFVYLDDIIFSGGRVITDLQAWIRDKSPDKATIHIIVMAYHTLGQYHAKKSLDRAIKDSGKNIQIHYWRSLALENRKRYKNNSDVLWPSEIPDYPNVQEYIESERRFPLEPRRSIRATGMFSSEEGRKILEREFLIAGIKIRSLTGTLNDWYRPLGCSRFGVGFGSLLATYRNCPNNCPLAIWWGDPAATSGALQWHPLLPRKTYSAPENIFSAFDEVL